MMGYFVLEVGENVPCIDVGISSHLERLGRASAFTNRSILKQAQPRVYIHNIQSRDVGRAHDPFIILDGIPLRHLDDCQLESRQVYLQVNDEFANCQAVSLRQRESLSWEQSANQSSVHLQRTSFYFPSNRIRPIKNDDFNVVSGTCFNGISKRPYVSIIPRTYILNVIDEVIHTLQLGICRCSSDSVQTIHLYACLSIDVVGISIACLLIASQAVLWREEALEGYVVG